MNCEHCKSVRTFRLHPPAIIPSVLIDFSTGNMKGKLLLLLLILLFLQSGFSEIITIHVQNKN